jgi:hypothetical protein
MVPPKPPGLTMFKEGFRTTYNPTENATLPPAASNPWLPGLSPEGGISRGTPPRPPVYFRRVTSRAVDPRGTGPRTLKLQRRVDRIHWSRDLSFDSID